MNLESCDYIFLKIQLGPGDLLNCIDLIVCFNLSREKGAPNCSDWTGAGNATLDKNWSILEESEGDSDVYKDE